ncbi:MAG: response regulator [Terriglobales bacterium]|jgi:FixJ family two-component response regulator
MPPLISVVDDDASVRESLESLIRSIGFAVKVFASAEEFLNSPRVLETNCLILDVRLPGMNGIDLHRYLLAKKWKVPVIFITAHASEEHLRSQALRSGAVDYLIKPFTEEALLSAVDIALSSKSNGTKDP